DAGAAQFDGYRFVHYGPAEGLIHPSVQAIAEDFENRIWFGTPEGASCFDGRKSFSLTTGDGLPDNNVQALRVDSQGNVWFGTQSGGAACYDGKTFTVYRKGDGLPCDDIRAIFEDSRGRLWFGGAEGGVACLDEGQFCLYTSVDGLAGERVPSICEDGRGRMWFSTWEEGLSCFDGKHFTKHTTRDGLLENRVTSIVRDYEGHLWIGHRNAGVTRFDPSTFQLLTGEPVTEVLYSDRKKRLWFGNHDMLCCVNYDPQQRRRFPHRIYDLLEDSQGRFWVATQFGGAYRFSSPEATSEEDGRVFTVDDGLGGNDVLSLLETRSGTIYAGTGYPGCLCRFDGERFESMQTPHEAVFRLFEDSKGRIWMGGFGDSGLSCLDGETLTTHGIDKGLPSGRIQSIAEDDAGNLWVGTQQGLCRYDGKTFARFGAEQGLVSLFHQRSAKDARGQLWFATLLGGLYRTDGRHFQWLTADDGLPCNSITGLAPQPYGSMIVGTYLGVVHYRPTATVPPQVKILELVAGEVYKEPHNLELTTTQAKLVHISFSGFSLSTSHMRYAYVLDGYDRDMRDTWSTQVRYEDLPVGTYTFRVTAINRDLVPSEEPAVLDLAIVPDPWEQRQAEFKIQLRRMERQIELKERVTQQNRALVALARSKTPESGDLLVAIREVTEKAVSLLDVDLVSVWLFTDDRTSLRCVDLYVREKCNHVEGGKLPVSKYVAYIAAIELEDVVAATDALTDPRTSALRDTLYRPLGITSTLDARIRVGGQTVGIVHHARISEPRPWAPEEKQFALEIAALLGQTMESCERTQAHETTRKSEEKYRSILDNIEEGYYEIDRDGAFTFYNDSTCRILGYTINELASRKLADCLDPESLDRAKGAFNRVARIDGPARGIEWRILRKDGGERFVQASVSLIKNARGETVGYRGILTDNSDRKRAELERRQLEEQIRHAQKLESLSILAEGLAHDFNNLLMG
ncbi:MAG: Response regulator, partial [Candidatus Hydrogenedentes bacterium]|nr:Response regulator [Candidatus Hydrogenedentota bacterium]